MNEKALYDFKNNFNGNMAKAMIKVVGNQLRGNIELDWVDIQVLPEKGSIDIFWGDSAVDDFEKADLKETYYLSCTDMETFDNMLVIYAERNIEIRV